MSNLKKILALVLALVMSFSVLTVASADFKDQSAVNEKYATAVNTLAALEVFKGYEDGSFNPKGTITRAEVAAIIYRIDTGDIYDKHVKVYADYSKFEDVASTAWYAGYVNYCANALYVKGVSETEFNPNGLVTGYQALAMILRVVGYDQNNEFSGSAWQVQVASTAQSLGLLKNVVNGETLGQEPATRELVAELLWQAINVPQVDYTLAFGYSQHKDPLSKTIENPSIEEEKIGLNTITLPDDIWGRPGAKQWRAEKWTKKVLATYEVKPEDTFTAPVVECEIAVLMGLEETANVAIYLNGVKDTVVVEPLHTSNHKDEHKIGEQGTLMEIYEDRIVMIDTYLAFVNKTVELKTDKAGHVKVPATNDIAVYGQFKGIPVNYTIDGNNYATGEYLLVNVYEGTRDLVAEKINANGRLFILGNPDEAIAKQTKIWWNAEKHTIDGKEYDDNVNYLLDAAQYDKTDAYRWFFDENGYVIGSTELPPEYVAKKYAVVLDAQWINVGAYKTEGYAYGTVQYLDGSEPVDTYLEGIYVNGELKEFEYATTNNAYFSQGKLCTTYQYNQYNEYTWAHLYEVVEGKTGLILKAVETELATATLKDGISRIDATEFYTDNETVYFFYNAKTGMLDMVKGYDNLNTNYNVWNIDIVDGLFAAQFIYVPVAKEITAAPTVETGYGYYYITNKAFNYTLKDFYAIFGVVDAEGNTDEPLAFVLGYNGITEEAELEQYLDKFVAENQDTLWLVEFEDGIVVSMEKVTNKAAGKDDKGSWKSAMLVDGENYIYIETGVLKVLDAEGEVIEALNVNGKTFIYNIDGVGTPDSLLDLDGNDLYVIYGSNHAYTIFVVPAED